MKTKKILVTGGSGFIGSHLVERLVALDNQVLVVDNFSSGLANRVKRADYLKADIALPSITKKFIQFSPDAVYHLAADNRVTSTIQETLKSNIIGTYNVLLASKAAKIKQFIFSSSAAVYGDSQDLPIRESWPNRPLSAYGVSKLTGEAYCRLFSRHFPTTIFRFANVYGPRQSAAAEGGAVAIFINKIINHKMINVYGDGRQTRDFVFVADVVDALVMALSRPQTVIANIGSNTATQILVLIKLLGKLLGEKGKIKYLPKREVEIEHSLFSHALATKKLAWRPRTSLKAGLLTTINYYK